MNQTRHNPRPRTTPDATRTLSASAQQTLATPAVCEGVGLHSGTLVTARLLPAPADTGIVFIRTDVTDRDNRIPALWNRVVDTRLCTVIGNSDGVSVATIEHLMAALSGCGVDNARIELDGPEVPAMDGSAAPFLAAIQRAGLRAQTRTRRLFRILQEVFVEEDDKSVRLSPSAFPLFAGHIDFDHPAVGRQSRSTALVNGNFLHDLADARTFGFLHEVEWMRKNGLALGGSFDNAIVVGPEGVLNPGGLRHEDEFIRHKLLDAVGDLYLAGGVLLGAYEAVRGGHALNNALLHRLFSTPGAWEVVVPAEAPSRAPFSRISGPVREEARTALV